MTKRLNLLHLSLVAAISVAIGYGLKLRFGVEWIDFAAFVTCVLYVYLASVESILTWPVSLVCSACWAVGVYNAKLYADFSLQLFFFMLSIHGWYQWSRGSEGDTALKITRLKLTHWPYLGIALFLGVNIYMPILAHFNASKALPDSMLTVTSIIGQYLQNIKKLENWLLWILVNVGYTWLYISRGGMETYAVLSGMLLIVALFGLKDWLKSYKSQEGPATLPAP